MGGFVFVLARKGGFPYNSVFPKMPDGHLLCREHKKQVVAGQVFSRAASGYFYVEFKCISGRF